MRRLTMGLSDAVLVTALCAAAGCSPKTQSLKHSDVGTSSSTVAYVEAPLPESERAYGTIDGQHLHEYVVEQSAIAHHYRDDGHPQFWGRIAGTSGDSESAQWLIGKFNKIGLTETRIQPIDLMPQWMAQSWKVEMTAEGKTVSLATAQPAYRSPGTSGKDLDLEVAYVGLGSEAEFAGRNVRGKAVFLSSITRPGLSAAETGALKRAETNGAAAIFDVNELPGNLKIQSYATGTNVPTFELGTEDGHAVRDMVAGGAGHVTHVRIHMDAQMVPNLKTALVWGKLPGKTDETIYIIAHRDGWFDAAGDNAGGVSSMLGLAEYFAKIPQDQRRRTMIFIGMDGHHNIKPGGFGREWLVAHRNEFFTKTALMINCEHPSDAQVYLTGGKVGQTDTTIPMEWYAGGPFRPDLTKIVAESFREFGVTTWAQPSTNPPAGDLARFSWFLPGVASASNEFFYFHTDQDTPEHVPWTGLQATTRAYAKIIDEVNKIELKDLQRPAEADPHAPGTPGGYI